MGAVTVASPAEQVSSESRDQFLAFVTDEDTHAVVDQVLGDLMLPHAKIRSGNIKEAARYLEQHRSPKLLLVDITGSELPRSDINALADVCEPGVTVIATGDQNDVALFRDLLAHGVADYLVKPITPALLQKSLMSATDHSAVVKGGAKLGRLIAVMGARGGVGSTTVATSVAWWIAHERRRRVVVVDLDLQFGTVALALDLEPSHGLREALENPNRIDGLTMERLLVQHSERLFVLSAEESPEETLLVDFSALELLVTELRNKFHYVVVDLPRTPGPCMQQVLQAATDLVFVSDYSLAGMRDAMRMTGLMPSINASCNVVLVVNRAGEHRHGEMPRAEFEKGVGRKIDLVLPFDARTVAAAVNFGQPVAATKGPVSVGLREVAERLCGPGPGAVPQRSNVWLRLLKKS